MLMLHHYLTMPLEAAQGHFLLGQQKGGFALKKRKKKNTTLERKYLYLLIALLVCYSAAQGAN